MANEHHRSVAEILENYSSVELTHWMVFFYLQDKELENQKEFHRTGIKTLNPRNKDEEMANIMRVLGIDENQSRRFE